jgi:isoleucyl-tRNA synthetase
VAEVEKLREIGLNVSDEEVFFLAWTTTPWTLPSNTALAVGKNITYAAVRTFNQYTQKPVVVILANDLFSKHFSEKNAELKLEDYKAGDKNIPFEVIDVKEDLKAREHMKQISGQMGVPVIDVDGKIMSGWDEEKFNRLMID